MFFENRRGQSDIFWQVSTANDPFLVASREMMISGDTKNPYVWGSWNHQMCVSDSIIDVQYVYVYIYIHNIYIYVHIHMRTVLI